jgi:hypothetical protein
MFSKCSDLGISNTTGVLIHTYVLANLAKTKNTTSLCYHHKISGTHHPIVLIKSTIITTGLSYYILDI